MYKSNDLAITSENLKDTISKIKKQGEAWNSQTYKLTPPEYVSLREGSQGKMMQYVKQFYTIRMLNQIFPGWQMEDMNFTFYPEVRTFVLTGYLHITYPSLITGKIEDRRIYAVGSSFILSKKDNIHEPVQPEDMAKACRTEWIKLAGMILGIGMDIYSQEITEELQQAFEEKVAKWAEKDIVFSIASSFTERGAFEKWISNLPTEEQAIDFMEIIAPLPAEKQRLLWYDFEKQNKQSVITWLANLSNAINKNNKG